MQRSIEIAADTNGAAYASPAVERRASIETQSSGPQSVGQA
jgi:hypothetical protein